MATLYPVWQVEGLERMNDRDLKTAAAMWRYYHRQGAGALTMMVKPVGKKAKAHFGYGVVSHALPGMPDDTFLSQCGRRFPRRVPWADIEEHGLGMVCGGCVIVELK